MFRGAGPLTALDKAPSARIALVSMPWARVSSPALAVGLLKAILIRAGHEVDACYANLLLAQHLGPQRYRGIVNGGGLNHGLLGEWLFTRAAFGSDALDVDAFVDAHPEAVTAVAEDRDSLRALHEHVLPQFIADLVDDRDWSDYDLIGFSSSFEQNVASLALARAIKERHPQVPIVFGGANVDGEMGPAYLRAIDWVDITVSGEADAAILGLVSAVMRNEPPANVPGVWYRSADEVISGPPATLTRQLDDLPTPDYAEYFALLERFGSEHLLSGRQRRLTFESSRGCWWGAKHHCTFCGLNALGMAYRSKSPTRVVDELTELAERHEVLVFEGADNIIDHASMSDLCDRLGESAVDWDLFYEVKANLTRAQLQMMAQAGIRTIQPGIESLSTNVLKLMRKGSTQLVNVRVLKWARAERMRVIWTILAGFPGETDEDYLRQARLIPLLHHLQPPDGVARLLLERFSPYFDEPGHGFRDVQPLSAYRAAYPVATLDHAAIAYAFDYEAAPVAAPGAVGAVREAVRTWQQSWATSGLMPQLRGLRGPGWIRVLDTRSGQTQRTTLTGLSAAVLAGLDDTYRSASSLARDLHGGPHAAPEEQIAAVIDDLAQHGFVIEDGGLALSLVLPPAR